MSGINKAIILGRLGKDPESRSTPTGTAVVSFSLAVSETWRDKQTGQKQEKTEWVNCVSFGKVGEIVAQYVHKGDMLYVEGKIETRKYQAQDGTDRYATQVNVRDVCLLGGKKDQQGVTGAAPRQEAHPMDDDDIPW
jgi:single-strand DNA-binding protein